MKVLKGLVIRPLRFIRVHKALKHVPRNAKLLDIGCGNGYLLFNASNLIKYGVGVDERITSTTKGNITLKNFSVKRKLPFKDKTFNAVTMTAFIEHLDNSKALLREVYRILRKDGVCIITTPTRRARLPWEFLVNLGLSDEESDEEGTNAHKMYFTPEKLKKELEYAKLTQIHSSTFELGMNYIVVAKK